MIDDRPIAVLQTLRPKGLYHAVGLLLVCFCLWGAFSNLGGKDLKQEQIRDFSVEPIFVMAF
jgi:hypothetical protein